MRLRNFAHSNCLQPQVWRINFPCGQHKGLSLSNGSPIPSTETEKTLSYVEPLQELIPGGALYWHPQPGSWSPVNSIQDINPSQLSTGYMSPPGMESLMCKRNDALMAQQQMMVPMAPPDIFGVMI